MTLALLTLLCCAHVWGQEGPRVTSGSASVIGSYTPCPNGEIPKANSGIWQCGADAGAGTGAPTDATYIMQTPNGTTTAEQALSTMATALLLNTTGTGVLTSYSGTTGAPGNQCLVSLNGVGAGSWSQITPAFLNFDPATQAELDGHAALTTSVHGLPNTANIVLKDGSVAMDELTLVDMDASPVANRQLRVIDGMVRCEQTDGTLTRCFEADSLELLVTANYTNASITYAKVQNVTAARLLGRGDSGAGPPQELTVSGCTITGTTLTCTPGGGGTAATTTFTPAGTIAANNVQDALVEVAGEAVQTTQVNVNSGVLGLDSTGYATVDRLAKPHTHTALAAASTTTCQGFFEYVEGSGGPVDITASPQLADGTRDGQICVLRGSHATNTVKYDHAAGDLVLCGASGSVLVGATKADLMLVWKLADSEWEQFGCQDLNGAKATGAEITTATSKANALIVGDGTSKRYLYSTGGKAIDECETAGAPCDLEQTIPNGKVYKLADHLGTTYLQVTNAGVASGPLAPPRTACYVLPQTAFADDNMLFGSMAIPITVTQAWCHYQGSAPTTPAQFQLVGMTHTAPTCAGPTVAATPQNVTAGGNVAAFVPIRFSVGNTPNPDGVDTYELCLSYRGQ